MRLLKLFTLAIALVTLAAPQLWACSVAGPNAHMGTVKAVDAVKGTLTIQHAENGEDLTFVADKPEMLKGIAPADHVTVVYTAQGKTLHIKSIKKG
jgi:predicted S18 family serine protease